MPQPSLEGQGSLLSSLWISTAPAKGFAQGRTSIGFSGHLGISFLKHRVFGHIHIKHTILCMGILQVSHPLAKRIILLSFSNADWTLSSLNLKVFLFGMETLCGMCNLKKRDRWNQCNLMVSVLSLKQVDRKKKK